jgi:hypothetical protein
VIITTHIAIIASVKTAEAHHGKNIGNVIAAVRDAEMMNATIAVSDPIKKVESTIVLTQTLLGHPSHPIATNTQDGEKNKVESVIDQDLLHLSSKQKNKSE